MSYFCVTIEFSTLPIPYLKYYGNYSKINYCHQLKFNQLSLALFKLFVRLCYNKICIFIWR